jgi:hypothetical protein
LIVTAYHETGGLAITGHDLSDEVPTDGMTEEEKRTLRIERVQNISVTWSSTYHTATNVLLYCFGSLFDELSNGSIIDNTEIYHEILGYYASEPGPPPPVPWLPTTIRTNVTTNPPNNGTTTNGTTTNGTHTTPTTNTTGAMTSTTTETTSTPTTSTTSSEESSTPPDLPSNPYLINPLSLGISVGSAVVVIVFLLIWKRYKR